VSTLPPTIHASAVLIGARAVLIRGPAGSGKSSLVLALLAAVRSGHLPFARLVADDRAHVAAINGRLIVRPPESLAGRIETRGIGISQSPYEPVAVVAFVADLQAADAERLPSADARTVIAGVELPRLAIAAGVDPLPLVLAFAESLRAVVNQT
jgi:HPr kinase/phosphorylase